MAGEMVTSSQSSQTTSPLGSISILVVDDDTTCLSIVAAMLKSWKYEVVTVKHAIEALCTLRIRGGSFDLVVTDVHMPDMNGFELQRQIHKEFKLPVVFMSADDKESVILKGLQSGAAFFIVKPISPNDLKNLWQYAVAKNKRKAAIIEEIGSVQETSQAEKASNVVDHTLAQQTSQIAKSPNQEVESASSGNGNQPSSKDSKRKSPVNVEKRENMDDSATPKKSKVVWTNALHNQFLEAIRSIGLERAVPKKILEYMNVPGLTRENIASHLQKYRIFLNRVSEASCKIQSGTEKSTDERTFRSSFASGQLSLIHNRPRVQLETSLQHNPSSSNQELASSRISIPRFGSGQSSLLSSQGNLKQPIMIGSAKPLYHQANSSPFIMEPNKRPTSLSFHGYTSGAGSNLRQMYQQNSQVAPKISTNGFPKYPNYNSTGYGNIGAFNDSNVNLKPNYSSNNYVGYRMGCDGRLVGLGYNIENMGAEPLTDFNCNNDLMNGMESGSMNTVPMLRGYSGDHLTEGVSSSTGFQSAIPQENNSVTQLQRTVVQQNSFGNEGEPDYIFGLLNNNAFNSDSNPNFQQLYGEGDLSFNFPNQINLLQSQIQQGGDQGALSSAFSFGPYDVGNNLIVSNNNQSLEQQSGSEVMVSNFGIAGSQLDEYFPSFDQHLSQLDDEEFLASVFGPGGYGGDDNPGGSP